MFITTRLVRVVALFVLLASASPTLARDWFVRADSTGDGSKESPFGDPFEALEKCEAGDAIHIAEGRYTGKLQNGEWVVPFEGVQLIGGYSSDWSRRDPWTLKTMLVWDRTAKNQPKDARLTANVRNVVIDGLLIDGREQNQYDADPAGRAPRSLDIGTTAVRLTLPSTVRNCVFLNTGREAIVCPNGSTIENNLFLNTFDAAVKVNGLPPASPESKTPAVIRNNTFLWSWCDRAPGKGRYSGAGIQMSGPATIANNIFAHCDNNAIYCTITTDRTSVTGNVFFMNLWSNFKMFVEGKDVVVDDKTMELLEDTGLKAFEGNQVVNPEMALDRDWVDGTAKRTASVRGKAEMDDWNKLRQTMGLPLSGTGGKAATGIAPAYPVEKVAALLMPGNTSIKAGARSIKLEPKFGGPSVATAQKPYEKSDLVAWARMPEDVDGKALEMTVAISGVANVNGIPQAYKKDDHEGIFLHDGMGTERITGFYRKGSAANRTVNEGMGKYNGNGKADRLYVVKGTAHALSGYPKAGFHIESIIPLESTGPARQRAAGRDWFVRAGATGGDGSRDKPFRDPFQPLERCEAGDTVHVAGGEYAGKLRAGMWKVDCPDVTMLGGYDKDFATRDPWKNPTLLYCPEDFKGRRWGYTLEGSGDHTGFVLDGFVFDKRLNNQYSGSGDLMVGQSDKSDHLWLSRPGCVVRNCVFLNGAEGAVRLTASQTVENCIFVNHYQRVVTVQRGFTPEVPLVFRDNTLAFAWEQRFGQGRGLTGDLLTLDGDVRAVIDNNVFAFADQHAIRMNANPRDVELTNNVFSHNLWAEVYRAADGLVVDNKNFGDLRQLGFKKVENNVLMSPGLPVDQQWFDVYLNRTAYVPGKVQMDDWNKLRDLIGQPMIATGGKAGTGMAPAMDRKVALALFPKTPQVKAGARPRKLEVKFEGVTRQEPQHDYSEAPWAAAASAAEWETLDGKRVTLKIAINREDNQWLLRDIKKGEYSVWQVVGPEGGNSPGLPLRVYTPAGTRVERVFRQAKAYTSGRPEETYVVKGVARHPRQMVVEAVERAD